ncbi:ABC transporter ATP-binding protein [Alteraurantiacibacter aestuarii]|uniref:ATP-binding cassette domain-containing protein n=1 Tax=Alteraurantiacibacter aestuarii TaxID=650004 RepID=A0A844ZM24_9SPHN|nr:ATP-binding cassette domain-containing protein [Alteraurantiacibacter aestuarii]MXO88156.1 ATP-binding cassette domain-containing protein [Alteraurantiacibacter aestuarii]
MNALLSLQNVWVEYGDKVVLERINLNIEAGSFVSIIGPSGAGKSSLLRVLLGQEAPTKGTILLNDEPLKPQCEPDRGVVFQRYSVFSHLTVLGNTVFGLECAQAPLTARLFGARRRAAEAEAEEMLAAVGLSDNLHLYPAQMSGGMQQRLAIAQALIKRPRLLLLDEPFGALDPGIRADMHALITRLWSDYSLTVVMVTHDIGEAFSLGTRVLTLDKARHDPHAPHRYGATVVYDLPLKKQATVEAGTCVDNGAENGPEVNCIITVDETRNN